ncbi:hypothetical protein [Hominifimenecus sp. rT4P-3]|uniref:hypothetical protein n=1 Tax=Hominifimenecus sp. rT4P-3 TaxID=3242979 RepID=UPI003DA36BE2
MKLRKVKIMIYIMIGIMGILLLAMMVTKILVLGYIVSATLIATAIFERLYWKCPYCGRFLGCLNDRGKYCQHCGKEIEI